MKILQINSGTMVNGTLTYCKFLSSELAQLGHEVTIAARPSSWLMDNTPEQVSSFQSSLSRSPRQLKRMAKWIQENEFDVMHTHMSRANALGVIMKMMTGVPVVATAHACSFQLHWPLNDFVLANSESTFRYYKKSPWNLSEKLKTIHCFTGLERFKRVAPINVIRVRRQLRLKGDEFVVGLVGEVVYRKGHQFLFEAMSKIVEAVPNFKLVLIGRFHRNEAFIQRLRRIQMTNGLFRRVKWLGFRYNVEDFMSVFDVCVVPSLQESLGLVALEASAAGTPVIASKIGGLPEVVRQNQNGILVPPRDSDALADSVIRLAKDQAERERMGEAGRSLVEQQFCPKKLALEVVKTYEAVTKKDRQNKHRVASDAA